MNRMIAFSLLLAAAAAGKTFAGEAVLMGDILVERAPVSTLTRAEVQADLKQFRDSGVTWPQEAGPSIAFHSERSRADVTAEYLAERDAVQAMSGEDSGSMYLAQHETGRKAITPVVAKED